MLYTPTTERVTACTHANGVDIWILSHESYSGTFIAHLLTQTGLAPGTVNSTIGPVFNGSGLDFLGNLKFSSQGNRVGMAVSNPDYFWLFDFDRATGILANPIQLQSTGNFEGAYGIEFSPNGNVLYGTSEIPFKFFQWDLTSGVAATIDATRIDIPVLPMGSSYTGGLQLAPDGKIYMTRNTCTWLAVVNNPDVYGAGCNYADSGLFLNGGTCIYGLPNLNQSVYQQVLIDKFCIGDTTTFLVSDSLSYFAFQWDFGDPGSGPLNVSYNASTSHYYSAPGNYTVQLIRGLFVAPFSDTATFDIEIKTCSSVIANLSCSDTLFCDKQCIDFFDQSQFNPTSWQWTFTGASPSSSTDQNPSGICYNNYGAFDVQLIACNAAGCDTVLFANFINEFQLPLQPTVTSSNDTLYCNATNVSFAWYNVTNPNLVLSTTNFFAPTLAGQYYVVITDSNNCAVASNVFSSSVGVMEITQDNISMNYNMELGQLIVENTAGVMENALLIIYDITGRKLSEVNIPESVNKYIATIPTYNQTCIAQLLYNDQSIKLKLISK
ncbi:MAG: PKD domain-containing protein [Bacteroidetes bacterium]|nr:PKD domain-containing protein [Bacteroidota bacterium]